MAVQVGIVGLPNAGSTTLFRALTRSEAGGSGKEHVGMAQIPDERLQQLADVV
jgi:ribosome-binding ATPase YchF (GTP1/OBG family)